MPTRTQRKLLIVDDDDELRRMLNIFLSVEDFDVTTTATGEDALRAAADDTPDLILLDLGLGDIDGKDVIVALRQWTQLPIIVVTGRAGDDETACALGLGADDYVTKPFSVDVLLARINANLRKAAAVAAIDAPAPCDIVNGPIRIDMVRHEVFIHDRPVPFSPKEFALLCLFVTRRDRVMTHKDILREVWGPSHIGAMQYLRVYIGQLRGKLETSAGLGRCIVSESGVGYRMETIRDLVATGGARR